MSIAGFLTIILWLVIICIVAWLGVWLVQQLGAPPEVQNVARIAIVVIAVVLIILLLVNFLGGGVMPSLKAAELEEGQEICLTLL